MPPSDTSNWNRRSGTRSGCGYRITSGKNGGLNIINTCKPMNGGKDANSFSNAQILFAKGVGPRARRKFITRHTTMSKMNYCGNSWPFAGIAMNASMALAAIPKRPRHDRHHPDQGHQG